ncbi:O-acetyl-ADP-ribose deacetylase, partial [Candidatus Gottesmanbacteria bacterium RBG_13_37_7]
TLLGGGGVDGAIHREAGPKLFKECRTLSGCRVGEAKITRGYCLKAPFVIHTVGPVWQGGVNNEAELLSNCYQNSLKLTERNNLRTIAFPAISTGIYGYPKKEAAKVAIETVRKYLRKSKIEKVIFVLHSDNDFSIYNKLFRELQENII